MSPRDLEKIRYSLLDVRRNVSHPVLDLHNKAYNYWKEFWRTEFRKNGLEGDVLHKDDFFRQDMIATLTYGDEIVGVHLYSKFNLELDAAKEHRYFKHNYDESFIPALVKDGLRTVLSLEYLTMNPEWRKSVTGVSIARVLVHLGTRAQQLLGCDASIGACRMDVKVNDMMFNCGGRSYGKTDLYNTPVEFVAIPTHSIQPDPDAKIQHLVDHYWEHRQDYSNKSAKPQLRRVA